MEWKGVGGEPLAAVRGNEGGFCLFLIGHQEWHVLWNIIFYNCRGVGVKKGRMTIFVYCAGRRQQTSPKDNCLFKLYLQLKLIRLQLGSNAVILPPRPIRSEQMLKFLILLYVAWQIVCQQCRHTLNLYLLSLDEQGLQTPRTSGYNICDTMTALDIQKEIQTILKEGFLDKESRFLKSWRSRWFVLTPQALMTFKQRKVYNNPTEVILLKGITSIKSADEETGRQFAFRLDTDELSYYIGASSNSEKEQWIGQIGKAMVKLNTKMEE